MAYLFGDSTPFPLDENFIDTLRDLTSACVALLRIDERLDDAYDLGDEARDGSEGDIARLEMVAASLVTALEPHMAEMGPATGGPTAAQIAVRVMQSARGVLESARSEAQNRRDASLRDVEGRVAEARSSIPGALETFFLRRELPDTVWRFRWKAGLGDLPGTAQVQGSAPFGLDVVMEVDVPRTHVYSRPIRVGDLEKNCTVKLPEAGGFIRRGSRMRSVGLDGYHVTEVERSPERASMILRKSNKQASEGLELILRQPGQSRPLVRKLTDSGSSMEDSVTIDAADAAGLTRLWAKVEASLDEFTRRRVRLVRATLDGMAARDVERPAMLAEKMIEAVAPIVREMRKRSMGARELVLKKDLGGGRREEIFIAREELVRKYADLSPGRRKAFDAFGLEGVGTDAESGVIIATSKDFDTEEDTNVDPRVTKQRSEPNVVSTDLN